MAIRGSSFILITISGLSGTYNIIFFGYIIL
jgi:hypothetical protein